MSTELRGLALQNLGELGLRILREPRHLPISWRVSFVSAFVGTYSHIAIDSIMPVDVFPLLPLSKASPLHGIITIDTLHVLCVATALLGDLVWVVLDRLSARQKS